LSAVLGNNGKNRFLDYGICIVLLNRSESSINGIEIFILLTQQVFTS